MDLFALRGERSEPQPGTRETKSPWARKLLEVIKRVITKGFGNIKAIINITVKSFINLIDLSSCARVDREWRDSSRPWCFARCRENNFFMFKCWEILLRNIRPRQRHFSHRYKLWKGKKGSNLSYGPSCTCERQRNGCEFKFSQWITWIWMFHQTFSRSINPSSRVGAFHSTVRRKEKKKSPRRLGVAGKSRRFWKFPFFLWEIQTSRADACKSNVVGEIQFPYIFLRRRHVVDF